MKWEVKKLGELFEFKNGLNFNKYQKGEKGFLTVDVLNMYSPNPQVDMKNLYRVDKDFAQDYFLETGDILFVRSSVKRDGVGWTSLFQGYSEPVTFCGFIIRARPIQKHKVNSEFIVYLCRSQKFRDDLVSRAKQSTITNISQSILNDITIPVPPLEEQKRIVEILDESFAGIERAEAIARQNLTNARELFDSYLNVLFSKNHEAWITGELAKIIGSVSTGPFGSLLHKSDYISDGIPLVNPANIDGDQIIPDKRKTVSKETLERLSNYALAEKDVVFGRRGEIGRCAVVKNAEAGWLCGTGCFFIKPHKNIDPTFVTYLLRSPKQRERLENLATGATMKNLSNTALSRFTISVPGFEEQKEIVFKLANLQEQIKLLEEIYQRKIEALGELKQSILQKAFSGQLTQ